MRKMGLFFLGMCAFFYPLHAKDSVPSRTEFWKRLASWPETLNANQMLEASLAASGVPDENLGTYTDYYKKIKIRIDFSTPETILVTMHTAFLRSQYSALQTNMDVLFRNGSFNCVSSAVLYMILAKDGGFSVTGVQTKDHAFCTVNVSDGKGKTTAVDVETTNSLGYNPGTKKEFQDSFSNTTGFAYVPARNYRDRKEISDKQMVCLIFQNRISILLRERKFAESKRLADYSWLFYPSQSNLSVLSTTVTDIAGELNNEHRYDDALDVLFSFSKDFGVSNRKTIDIILTNKINTLSTSGDIAGMKSMLSDRKDVLSQKQTKFLETAITLAITQNAVNKILDSKDMSESEKFFAAYTYLNELPQSELDIPSLSRLRDINYRNWTASIHNLFAQAANAGQNQKAQSILNEALKKDPENKTFKQDLQQLRLYH